VNTFHTVLRPNRSFPVQGSILLVTGVTLLSFVVGLVFEHIGAWPITAILMLNPLWLSAAFYLNYRSSDELERIFLDAAALTVEHVDSCHKVQRWQFNRHWVRVRLESTGEEIGYVQIGSHGRWVTVGRFLSPTKRSELAATLKAALTLSEPSWPL
jgi:uncharacterized membrane protein